MSTLTAHLLLWLLCLWLLQMACNASTVVAWQHDQIPGLVTELWRGLTEPHENDAFKVGQASLPV